MQFKITKGTVNRPKRIMICGAAGVGKAQPLNTPVMTPEGWRRIGDLRVGDAVLGSDGRATKVVAVHERGVLPTFRVTTSDGASTLCCGDHLWSVTVDGAREKLKTLSTAEMSTNLKTSGGKHVYQIPPTPAAHFSVADDTTIHPWLLGAWLGDGHNPRSPIISMTEEDLLDKVEELAPKADVCARLGSRRISITKGYRGGEAKLSAMAMALIDLGLEEVDSHNKFIPKNYLRGSVPTRLAVLQGLFDTDGNVPYDGARFVEYSTASSQLADDVEFLVRSLGGIVSRTLKDSHYTKGGERFPASPSHRIRATFFDDTVPVTSEKHLAKFKSANRRVTGRPVVSIEKDIAADCRCITVANEDGLYITEDFLLTHNSTFAAQFPEPIFIDAEKRTGHLDINRVEVGSWDEIQEVVKFLLSEEHSYKTVVFDTVDAIEKLIWEDVCKKAGKTSIEDFGYGKGYILAMDQFRRLVTAMEMLCNKGLTPLLIGHTMMKMITNPNGADYVKEVVKLHQKSADILRERVDAIGHAYFFDVVKEEEGKKSKVKATGQRKLRFGHTPALETKRGFDLPDEIMLDYKELKEHLQ